MFQGMNKNSMRRPKYTSSKSMIVYPSPTSIEEADIIVDPVEEDKVPFVVLPRSNSVKMLVSQIENKNIKVDIVEPEPIVPIVPNALMNKLLNMNKYKTNI